MDTSTPADNTIRAQFGLRALLMAASCKASKKDLRRALTGVTITRAKSDAESGVFAVGTDGACIVVAHDQTGVLTGPEDSIIIDVPTALVSAAKKGLKDPEVTYYVCVNGDRVSVECDAGDELFSLKGLLIEDVLPIGWQNIIPRPDRLRHEMRGQWVQPYLLGMIAKVGQYTKLTAGAGTMSEVTLYTVDDELAQDHAKSIVAKFGFDDAMMVVNPMHSISGCEHNTIFFALDRERKAWAAEQGMTGNLLAALGETPEATATEVDAA